MNYKYKDLVDKYKDYLKSTEASAVYLVKKYVQQIEAGKKWIDIVSCDSYYHRTEKPAFNYIIIEIFDKKKFPVYPIKLKNQNDFEYRQICKAITWNVSHDDINAQRIKGLRGSIYLVLIPLYNKNRGKKVIIEKSFWNEEYGGFDYTGKVPTTIKKIEKDMEPEWDYYVKAFKKITDKDIKRIENYFHSYIGPKIIEERRNLIEWYFIDYKKISDDNKNRKHIKKTIEIK